MNLKNIIAAWLKENNYDGLVQENCECGCEISDLMPCDNFSLSCSAGYKKDADPSTGYDFVITKKGSENKRELEEAIDKEFSNFWAPIIFDEENGKLNLEQLKKELYDYSMLMLNISKVYCEITDGKLSKPNTDPDVIIAEFHDVVSKSINEAIEEESIMFIQRHEPEEE